MTPFEYVRVKTARQAWELAKNDPEGTAILAGGTDLVAEMREGTRRPRRLVSLREIPGLREIAADRAGLRIGALATLAEIAEHQEVRKRCGVLADAAAGIASPQIRSVATAGGNLCQRPRCLYYRSVHFHCLRKGGAECFAIAGDSRYAAIFGGKALATAHPSDLAPVLIALGARVTLEGEKPRTLPLEQFYVLPTRSAPSDILLRPGEVLTEVLVPALPGEWRFSFQRETERAALCPALASAAVGLCLRDGTCREARVLLGGVAPIPWRAAEAEKALQGCRVDSESAKRAAEAAVQGAEPLPGNAHKVALARAVVRRAILRAAGVGIE